MRRFPFLFHLFSTVRTVAEILIIPHLLKDQRVQFRSNCFRSNDLNHEGGENIANEEIENQMIKLALDDYKN